jgi:hypothetical protein
VEMTIKELKETKQFTIASKYKRIREDLFIQDV